MGYINYDWMRTYHQGLLKRITMLKKSMDNLSNEAVDKLYVGTELQGEVTTRAYHAGDIFRYKTAHQHPYYVATSDGLAGVNPSTSNGFEHAANCCEALEVSVAVLLQSYQQRYEDLLDSYQQRHKDLLDSMQIKGVAKGWYESDEPNDPQEGDIVLDGSPNFLQIYTEGYWVAGVPSVGDAYWMKQEGGDLYVYTQEEGWKLMSQLYPSLNFMLKYVTDQTEALATTISLLQNSKPIIRDGRLELTSEGKVWFTTVTELKAPSVPTIATTSATVEAGNASFGISAESGATVYYRKKLTENGAWSDEVQSSSISEASGFTANTTANTKKEFWVQVRAVKNGQSSSWSSDIKLTINPTLPANNRASVAVGNVDGGYATSVTITFNPSTITGAKSEYKIGNGEWTEFSSQFTEQRSTAGNTSANYYQVRTSTTNSDYTTKNATSGNTAFTLGLKKFYYGWGEDALDSESDITALGNATKNTIQGGRYSMSITQQQINDGKGYMWWCGRGTISGVTSSGFTVPIQPVVSQFGYNCYRIKDAVVEAKTFVFDVTI